MKIIDTKELFDIIKARKRMCESMTDCDDCPMGHDSCGFDDCYDIDDLIHLIRMVKEWDAMHSTDVKPVVKGRWLCESTKCRIGYNDYEYWNKWRCSCCGYIRTEGWEHTSEGQEPKNILICENCGADMRKEKEDGRI